MALAPSAGVLSNPARTSTSLKTCHSPIQPSSSYGTLHHPGRLHSSVTSRAICNAAARFGTNSCCSMHDSKAAGQTAHASGVVRPLQLSPPAGAHVASHCCKRRASTCVSCSNSSSDSLPYEHSPRPISPVPRSQSPFTTAEPVQLPTTSPTSSIMSTEQQHSQSGNTSMPPAAASAVLPSVDLSPSDTAAQIAAAAEAQAAVTANLSVSGMCGQHLSSSSATTQEAKLQDLLTFLRLQVRVDQNNEAAMHTLLQLVKSAAINQLPISSLMAPSNLKLWQRLLTAEPPVAVLAAEVLCRVCNQDLQPWTQQLTTIIPILLTVVENRGVGDAGSQTPASDDPEVAGSAPGDSKSTPLVFFAISALVRMSAVEALAVEIVKQGGVQQLIAALAVTNAAVRQVTTFALFRLMREVDGDLSDDELMHWPNSSIDSSNDSSSSSSATVIDNGKDQASSRQLLLVQYVKHGAFPKLCSVLSDSGGGSAHELAVSMLLSMSIIPEVSRLVADKNEVRDIVKVLSETNSGGTRLEAMLITARLCARHTPCQQDAVREGAVPVLVQVMNDSSSTDEERCHAARLLAILGQHASTHQIMLESGALSAAIKIIEDRGHQRQMYNNILAARLNNIETSDKKPLELWEAAQAIYNAAIAVGLSGPAASSAAAAGVAAAVVESGDRAEQHKVTVQQQFKKLSDVQQQQQSQQRRVSAGGSSGGSGTESHSSSSSSISSSINSSTPIGPALVLEQAAGVVCMLSHNLDNHFKMVGEGVVPLLVSLINKGTLSKTLSYCLASLLMFAVSEPRHAAVVARTGAVPCLVELVGTSAASVTVSNREMSAALLAVLCRSPDVADEVVAAGGIQALVRLLGDDVSSGRCYACEALSQLAACSALRCQQVMRAQVMTPLKIMISNSTGSSSGSSSVSSQSLMWSSRLLQVLAGDPGSLRELCRTPGLVAMIPDILRKQTVLPAAATAAGLVATGTGSSSSSGSGRVLPSSVFSSAARIPDIPLADVWNSFSSRDGVSDSNDDTEMTTLAAAAAVDPGLWRDADLEKAQSNLCWVTAALATDAITRPVVLALGCDLVKPLVIILRDSQAGQGSGYSLSEVLEGITHSRQAAAAAALRALSRCDDQLAAAINAELTVQMWLGYRVELPVVDGDSWPFAPGWYLRG